MLQPWWCENIPPHGCPTFTSYIFWSPLLLEISQTAAVMNGPVAPRFMHCSLRRVVNKKCIPSQAAEQKLWKTGLPGLGTDGTGNDTTLSHAARHFWSMRHPSVTFVMTRNWGNEHDFILSMRKLNSSDHWKSPKQFSFQKQRLIEVFSFFRIPIKSTRRLHMIMCLFTVNS